MVIYGQKTLQVAAEWFAPAGINKGSLGGAIDTRYRLYKAYRDALYGGRGNPSVWMLKVGQGGYISTEPEWCCMITRPEGISISDEWQTTSTMSQTILESGIRFSGELPTIQALMWG